MLTFFVVLIVTLLVMLLVGAAIFFGRAPTYHVTQQQMQSILLQVVEGRCELEQWMDLLSMPIRHDADLEAMRLKLIEYNERYGLQRQNHAGFLLNETGVAIIRDILAKFEQQGKKMF